MSVLIFQTFSCHDVGSHENADAYMVADHRVSCDSERYTFAFWWAVAMVLVYPVGECESIVDVCSSIFNSVCSCVWQYVEDTCEHCFVLSSLL